MKKNWNIKNIDELKDFILNHSSYFKNGCNWNLDNKNFLERVLLNIPNKIYSITALDDTIKGIPLKLSNLKRASNISLKYWKSIGWENEEEIKNKISFIQKTNSKACIEYWIKRGLNEELAKEEIKKYQSKASKKAWENDEKMKKSSPMFKEYWIEKGYTLEESINKINPSNRDYYNYETDDDYLKHNLKNSLNIKNLWKNGVYDNCNKLYESRYISEEEKIFFKYLKDNEILNELKHNPFGINTRRSKKLNKYFVVADGYLKIEEGIILFEYDGTYYHDENYDKLRDNEIFKLRKDIIGIIRITDNYFKLNKKNVIKIKIDLENGISKIKSKKRKTIIFK